MDADYTHPHSQHGGNYNHPLTFQGIFDDMMLYDQEPFNQAAPVINPPPSQFHGSTDHQEISQGIPNYEPYYSNSTEAGYASQDVASGYGSNTVPHSMNFSGFNSASLPEEAQAANVQSTSDCYGSHETTASMDRSDAPGSYTPQQSNATHLQDSFAQSNQYTNPAFINGQVYAGHANADPIFEQNSTSTSESTGSGVGLNGYRPAVFHSDRQMDGLSSDDSPADDMATPMFQTSGNLVRKNPKRRRQLVNLPPEAFSLNGKRTRDLLLCDAVPSETSFGGCVWGAIEILTFHPHGTQQPLPSIRLICNGWKETEIATAQLYARDRHARINIEQRHEAIKHETNKNGKILFQDKNFTPTRNRARLTTVNDYRTGEYKTRSEYGFNKATFQPKPIKKRSTRRAGKNVEVPSLIQLAHRVVNWPKGEDAGIVTQAIRWACATKNDRYTIANIEEIARMNGFLPTSESLEPGWDQKAKDRMQKAVNASDKYKNGDQS